MTARMTPILCAVDFSEFSDPVMEYGSQLAAAIGAHLFVFHAVHFSSDQLYGTDFPDRGEIQKKLSRLALEKIEAMMEKKSVSWQPAISCGEPLDEINRIVAEKAIGLVIAASHGLSGFKRLILGNVVERLAHTLPCPLLVVRPSSAVGARLPKPGCPPKEILVGCSLMPGSDPVLSFAATFADKIDAGLHLVHAMASPVYTAVIDPTDGPYDRIQSRLQTCLNEQLEDVLPDTVKTGRDLKTTVTPGNPAEALVSQAIASKADLILLGINQKNRLKKVFVGSTIEPILRQAPCPVLTFPGAMAQLH